MNRHIRIGGYEAIPPAYSTGAAAYTAGRYAQRRRPRRRPRRQHRISRE